jgi:hypothetical protein
MRSAAVGCLVIVLAFAAMIGLWWLLTAFVFSTGDDGPRPMTYSTLNHRSTP